MLSVHRILSPALLHQFPKVVSILAQGGNSEVSAQSIPMQHKPTFSRSMLGACACGVVICHHAPQRRVHITTSFIKTIQAITP